ncbi:hypothetical protein [Endozoicomonas sp. Mp262]|uniref:hypothetical protein n=1 Tax=Endozoicomonas sp. Mp262 TaxID=2919499 RepID=UPI0021D7E01A
MAKPEATPTRTKELGVGLAGLEGYEYNTKERDMKFASDMLGFVNGFVDDVFAAKELYGSVEAYMQDLQIRSAA